MNKNIENKCLFLGSLNGMTYDEAVDYTVSTFEIEKSHFDKFEILIGSLWEASGWEGCAFYLVKDRETGLLYEVNAEICSLYGFDGQWELQPTSEKYLLSDHFPARDDEKVMDFLRKLFSETKS
jgi:hypothetical protein